MEEYLQGFQPKTANNTHKKRELATSIALPAASRYRSVVHALYTIARTEGFVTLGEVSTLGTARQGFPARAVYRSGLNNWTVFQK